MYIEYVWAKMFNIDRTTIFIFSFHRELVIQLNGSALAVLKHYITQRIREFLIDNSSNQLLYGDIKNSCVFVAEIVETLQQSN